MKTLLQIKFTTLFVSLFAMIICLAFTLQVIGTGFGGVALVSSFLIRTQIREMYRV